MTATPRLPCTVCGRRADTLHVLPWVVPRPLRGEQRVEFACPHHDPGGYWFPVREYFDGPPDWRDPTRRYTIRDHILDTKRLGRETVALIDAAIERGAAAGAGL